MRLLCGRPGQPQFLLHRLCSLRYLFFCVLCLGCTSFLHLLMLASAEKFKGLVILRTRYSAFAEHLVVLFGRDLSPLAR